MRICCPALYLAVQDMLISMKLAIQAGGQAWLVRNAAMAAWNTYMYLMQRECYADLAGLLLPLLRQLLQVGDVLAAAASSLQPQA